MSSENSESDSEALCKSDTHAGVRKAFIPPGVEGILGVGVERGALGPFQAVGC